MPRYLTKSRFKLAVECPTKLFYTGKKDIYRDQTEQNDCLAALAEGGYQVGELAKMGYLGGVEIESSDNAIAEAQTAEHLKLQDVVLFEPAIRFGNFVIRVDILIKRGKIFELIDVKAKSYDSTSPDIETAGGEIKSGMLP